MSVLFIKEWIPDDKNRHGSQGTPDENKDGYKNIGLLTAYPFAAAGRPTVL